jgi:hypothetical protein
MKLRAKYLAPLALATLASAAAAAAFAQDTVIVYTTPRPADYYYVPDAMDYYYEAPVDYYAPPIRVYRRRATEDQLITQDVVDELADDPRLSGRIGVETYRSEVTLRGRVSTPGQADRAGRDASRVAGVSDVHNELRPSVGAF